MPITIDKGSEYFVTTTYTGDGTNPRTVTTGLANDFVWIKSRTDGDDHRLVDSVRGASAFLESDSTLAEATTPANVLSFTSTGFTLSAGGAVNFNGESYVSWSWVGGGAGVSNTQGTITSTVSANTTSGFSIVSYTGNGSSSATVGHGLGVTPSMIICKGRNYANSWFVYHKSLSANNFVYLNYTDAQANANTTGGGCLSTSPTSSTFGFQSGTSSVNNVNTNGNTYIAYCFAEVKGFSKFGSYTGNGSTDGTFVYTGFKPAWVLVKVTSTTDDWNLIDNKRDPYNEGSELVLYPNSTATDTAATRFDMLSNGFKMRTTNVSCNGSGSSYIYMAFAENPFVSSKGVAVTAR